MFQVLDNGDRHCTRFIIRPQPENMAGRPGYGVIQNAGRDIATTMQTIKDQMVLINETYGTKRFGILIED